MTIKNEMIFGAILYEISAYLGGDFGTAYKTDAGYIEFTYQMRGDTFTFFVNTKAIEMQPNESIHTYASRCADVVEAVRNYMEEYQEEDCFNEKAHRNDE